MDSERAAFLRILAETPDDTTTRLVFADWLDERAPGRGEFVRLDLRLAALSADDPGREGLLARRAELLQAHAEGWIADLPAFPGVAYRDRDGPRFDRGVPGLAVTSWAALRACGADLFAALPIRCLRIDSTDRSDQNLHDLEAIAQQPWLARVRELELGVSFVNAMVPALAAAPHLANLTALRVRTWTGLNHRGLPPLVESPHLGRLEELELSGHDIGEEECELVANSQHLPRLVSFVSRGVQMAAASVVTNRAVAAFAAAPAVRLRALRLPNHSCNGWAMNALRDGPATADLEVLDLSGNAPIRDAGVTALVRSQVLTGLRELNLRSTGLTDAGVRAIATSPILRGLRALNLVENRFTDEGATALALSHHLLPDCRVRVGWYPHFRAVTGLGLSALRERFPRLVVEAL